MKNMMLYKSGWGTESSFVPTFKMIPTLSDCPFNEVLFDPNSKILAVVSKEKKQAYRLVPKLNDKGRPVIVTEKGVPVEVQERKLMDNFYEYYLENLDDVQRFIEMFAINSESFDWKEYFKEEKKQN
jgi:hypothetical protein